MVDLFSDLWTIAKPSSMMAVVVHAHTNSGLGHLFSTALPAAFLLWYLGCSHSHWGEMKLQHSLIFIFLMAGDPDHFVMSLAHLYFILLKCPVLILCLFLNWIVCFILVEFLELFTDPGYYSFIRCMVHRYLLSFIWLSLCWVFPLLCISSLVDTMPFVLVCIACLLGFYQRSSYPTNVLQCFPPVFLWWFYGFRSWV